MSKTWTDRSQQPLMKQRPSWDQVPSGGTSTYAMRGASVNQSAAPPASELPASVRFIATGFGIAGMVAAWVMEGELTQTLQNDPDDPVTPGVGQRPFLITYCARVAWMVLLLGWLAWRGVKLGQVPKDMVHAPQFTFFSRAHYIKWGSALAVGVSACSYTWFISLNDTSVSANTSVYNSAPVFVFLMSIPILSEKVTWKKVLSVLLTVGGVVLVQLLDTSSQAPEVLSYLSIAGATLSPAFDPSVKSYSATWYSKSSFLEVDATLKDPDTDADGTATLFLNGRSLPVPSTYGHSLAARINVSSVIGNGGKLTISTGAAAAQYTVAVRSAPDPPANNGSLPGGGGELASLTLSAEGPFAALTPVFSPSGRNYSALVTVGASNDGHLSVRAATQDGSGVSISQGSGNQSKCPKVEEESFALCTLPLELPALAPFPFTLHSSAGEYTFHVSLATADPPPRKMDLGRGYFFLVLSVVLYSIYEVGYKAGSHTDADTTPIASSFFWLGLMGLLAVLLIWPMFIILHVTGVETFRLPTGQPLLLLCFNSCLDMLFNVCLLLIIAMTSPLFASVASILTIPSSILADYLLHGTVLPTPCFAGIAMIAVGVLIMVSEGHGH